MRIGQPLTLLAISLLSMASPNVLAVPIVPEGYSVRVVARGLGIFPQALDVSSAGTIYVADYGGSAGSAYRVTPAGDVTRLEGPFQNEHLQGLVVSPSGDVFVSSEQKVFRLPAGARSFSILGEMSSRFNARDICGDLALRDTTLYVVGQGGYIPPLWSVDGSTGRISPFETSLEGGFTALTYERARDLLIGAGESGLFEVDPTTGRSTMFSFSAPGEPVTRTFFDCTTGTQVTVTTNP